MPAQSDYLDSDPRFFGGPFFEAVPVRQDRTPYQWTIITVTYNSERAIKEFWDRVPADIEWLVVDNGSRDDTIAEAQKRGAVVIPMGINAGFSAGNNLALHAARGKYVLFANPDLSVDFEALSDIAGILAKRSFLVAPKLTNSDGSEQLNGRGFPYLVSKIANRILPVNKHRNYRIPLRGHKAIYVPWAVGAALCARAEDLRRIGGWDSSFFLYYEDHEICLRAWEMDLPVVLLDCGRWPHGWARETAGLKLSPWKREIASMFNFYAKYPEFLMPRRAVRPALKDAALLAGTPVSFGGTEGVDV